MTEHHTETFTFYPITVPSKSSLKTVNFYLLSINNQLLLFDAGWTGDEYWTALQQTLEANHFTLGDLSAIVLSHHHGDHCGLVNHIAEQQRIPVYAHEKSVPRLKRDEEFLKKRVRFFEELYKAFDCGESGKRQVHYLTQSLEKNRNLAIKTDILPIDLAPIHPLTPLHFPGHAPDQIGLWDQSGKVLFGADVLIQHISSNALVEPDDNGERLPTLHQHVESLKAISSLPVKQIYSGHGAVIHNPHELIRKRLTRIKEKGEKIVSLIQKGASTGKDIARSYYGSTYDQQFSLVMSEIIGQLDYLERKGRIKKTMNDGIYYYSPLDF